MHEISEREHAIRTRWARACKGPWRSGPARVQVYRQTPDEGPCLTPISAAGWSDFACVVTRMSGSDHDHQVGVANLEAIREAPEDMEFVLGELSSLRDKIDRLEYSINERNRGVLIDKLKRSGIGGDATRTETLSLIDRDKALYVTAEAALNVYLDAHRKAVGSPEETPVGWSWLNALGARLKAIFPAHPELP